MRIIRSEKKLVLNPTLLPMLLGTIVIVVCATLDGVGKNNLFHIVIFWILLSSFVRHFQDSKFLRLLPGRFLLALVLSLSTSISLALNYFYGSGLSYGFAESVLGTNISEALSILKVLWPSTFIFVFTFILYWHAFGKSAPPTRFKKKIFTSALILYLSLMILDAFILQPKNAKAGVRYSSFSKFISRTPAYNFSKFIDAQEMIAEIKGATASKFLPTYNLGQSDGHQNILIIIGESARRDRWSIYGYHRDTSPNLISIKDELIVVKEAISPAAYTLLAVPLSLSHIAADANDILHQRYNSIIDLANHLGYVTHWISFQGKMAIDNTSITAHANKSKFIQWASGHDGAAVSILRNLLLKSEEKKFIIIHLNGSHEDPCDRLPEKKVLIKGLDHQDDCYDSTILHTDKLIHDLIHLMKGSNNSTLVYYSDHGLIKQKGEFLHANGIPPKSVLDIPFFVWSNNPSFKNRSRTEGQISGEYSLLNNYFLFSHLMGIEISGAECLSILKACYPKSDKLFAYDTSGKMHNYSDLPSH